MNYIPVIGFAISGGLSIYLGFALREKNRVIGTLKSYVRAVNALEEVKTKKVVAKKRKVKKDQKK